MDNCEQLVDFVLDYCENDDEMIWHFLSVVKDMEENHMTTFCGQVELKQVA